MFSPCPITAHLCIALRRAQDFYLVREPKRPHSAIMNAREHIPQFLHYTSENLHTIKPKHSVSKSHNHIPSRGKMSMVGTSTQDIIFPFPIRLPLPKLHPPPTPNSHLPRLKFVIRPSGFRSLHGTHTGPVRPWFPSREIRQSNIRGGRRSVPSSIHARRHTSAVVENEPDTQG